MPVETMDFERARQGGGYEFVARVKVEPTSIAKKDLPPRGGWTFEVEGVAVERGMRVNWFAEPFEVVAVSGGMGGRRKVTIARRAAGQRVAPTPPATLAPLPRTEAEGPPAPREAPAPEETPAGPPAASDAVTAASETPEKPAKGKGHK